MAELHVRQYELTGEGMLSDRALGTTAACTGLQPGSAAIGISPLLEPGEATSGKTRQCRQDCETRHRYMQRVWTP